MSRGWAELLLLALWLLLITIWTTKFRDEHERDFFHELLSDRIALRTGVAVSAILLIVQAVIGQLLYGVAVAVMWGFIISCAVHVVHRRRHAET